ncbi:transcriptional regulator [Rhodoplanes elegans]|uniref:Transcriptional regulator n=1 Tax=Rhodoplanes elegans TaxID=29408 RepID=A0A327KVJ4_9BRAD|nr:helix-turn-helix domain-containing protein [Rhodoplanes elegans]MBK5957694.1 transcriptional regulator [Rhodoplanes elegans]RAI41535.1 transcriptional regulator [Rhodoplanes elegans]
MPKPSRTYDCGPGCPVEATLDLIDGKWKGVVLYHLLDGCLRFNALRRKLPGVTQRVLTRQLRELEETGLIVRTVYAEVPPRVEYRLSTRGESLRTVILALKAWGDAYLAERAANSKAEAAPSEAGPLVSDPVPG